MDRLVYAIYWLLSHAICLLPITGVFRLGWALGTCVYYVAWPYRRLVLHNLGIAFGNKGDFPSAIAAFERALAIDPTFADAQRNLQMARTAVARR